MLRWIPHIAGQSISAEARLVFEGGVKAAPASPPEALSVGAVGGHDRPSLARDRSVGCVTEHAEMALSPLHLSARGEG
jgi:hypothetical protein